MWIPILAGLLSGVVSGMGIGGGTILIPLLTMFAGADQHMAQGVNLLYFLPTAAVALYVHRKNNAVQWRLALPCLLFGTAGAVLGAWLAVKLEPQLLRRLFGIFLFFMGGYEIKKGITKKDGSDENNQNSGKDKEF